MFPFTRDQDRSAFSGPRAWAGVLCFLLALPGCAVFRGEKFEEDEFSTLGRRLRPSEANSDAWGVSNKALQIERNLGVQ